MNTKITLTFISLLAASSVYSADSYVDGDLTVTENIFQEGTNKRIELGNKARIDGTFGALQNTINGASHWSMLWNAYYDWETNQYKFQNSNSQGAL